MALDTQRMVSAALAPLAYASMSGSASTTQSDFTRNLMITDSPRTVAAANAAAALHCADMDGVSKSL